MKNLTIRLPDDLRRELKELARQEHRSECDLERAAIRRYVTGRRFRLLRIRTLPFAEAQGLLTDDDIFRDVS
jgi:predicted transcriptional regulator